MFLEDGGTAEWRLTDEEMLLHVCLIAKDLAKAWPKRGVVPENVEMKPQQPASGNWCRQSAYSDTL
jgi:hypothetical protein